MEFSDLKNTRSHSATPNADMAESIDQPAGWRRVLDAVVQLPGRLPFAARLAVSISLLISVVMLLTGALMIRNQSELLERNMRTFGQTVVQQAAESAKEPLLANDGLLLQVLTANLASSDQIVGTEIYSKEGRLLARAGLSPFQAGAPFNGRSEPFLDDSDHTISWQWNRSTHNPVDAIAFVSPVRFRDVVVGYAIISFSRELMTQTLRESLHSIVKITLVLVSLGVLLSYLLGQRLTRPLRNLLAMSRAIGSGLYEYRITERRHDEIGYLMHSFNAMAEGLLQKRQVEQALSRYVPPEVARRVVAGLEPVELGGNQAYGSVMFVDIVDFTARSETMPPEKVAVLLNEFYRAISSAASLYHGTIDKYMGDCAMVVFGVPDADEEHAFHAIACAVFFQQLARQLNRERRANGLPPMHYRIGVNAGEMLAGNIGTQERVQYTVVGDSVNLASRLCSVSTAGQIIISEQMLAFPGVKEGTMVREFESIRIRGKAEPVSTFLVEGLRTPHDTDMQDRLRSIADHRRNWV